MMAQRLPFLVAACALLSACVTINIYFPEAAAEKAADQIIRDILGEQAKSKGESQEQPPPAAPETPQDSSGPERRGSRMLTWLLERIPSAHAAEADISIDTPAIRQIRASMKKRHATLKPYYDSGAIGYAADGLVATRDLGSVSLKDRNVVKKQVSAENSDRNKLYREIAKANGHPEWEADVRATFARQWVRNAAPGWWYQDGKGSWDKK